MIRKCILIAFIFIAFVTGLLGASIGSGYTSWNYNWMSDDYYNPLSQHLFIGWGTNRTFIVQYINYTDKATPQTQERSASGVIYNKHVSYNKENKFYIKSHTLALSYYNIIVISLVLALYPTIVFTRGRWRHWQRMRKGLCLKCGYDLTGNITGICSECGYKVK